MSNGIELHNITKRYGSLTAVDDVSLSIKDNEFFALLGPSGCGKTTLLRSLAGFETPQEGRIIVGGVDVTHTKPSQRPLNLMFQSYALFPHMSVEKNIAYGLEMEKLPKAEIAARVGAVIDSARLGDFAKRKPDQLSGGQRQRVALARALVKRPRVLLLDEPLSALDKKLRGEMQLELKRLQNEVGITFLMVTHDQEEALVMADRIAVLHDGKLAQVGTPVDLYEHPKTRFVANFIGEMNFLSGTATTGGVEIADAGLLRGTADTAGGTVIAVRPERISLQNVAAQDGQNSLHGTVFDTAYHGSDLSVHLKTCGGRETIVARMQIGQIDPASITVGSEHYCVWSPDHTRILNA